MKTIRLYRPSTGTEGRAFYEAWCCRCARDKSLRDDLPVDECDDAELCPIIAMTLSFELRDPKYPREWCYDEHGLPQCTAFVSAGDQVPPPRCKFTLELPL